MGILQPNVIKFQNEKQIKQPNNKVQNSIRKILQHHGLIFTEKNMLQHIKILLQQILQNPPLKLTDTNKLNINRFIFILICHKKYPSILIKLIHLFLHTLHSIMNFKSLLIVHIDDWKLCNYLSRFLLIITDNKTLKIIQQLYYNKNYQGIQLDQQSQGIIIQIQKKFNFRGIGNIINKLQHQQIEKIQQILRSAMIKIILLKQSFLTRSAKTFKIINQLFQDCFILYLRIYFSKYCKFITSKYHQNLSIWKQCITIGTYFVYLGIDKYRNSLYQSGITFLNSIISQLKQYQNFSQSYNFHIEPYKSYLFPNLPALNCQNIYQQLLCNLLYSLKCLKKMDFNINIKIYKLKTNRIMVYKLIISLLQFKNIKLQSIQYYLYELCKQNTTINLQRVYLSYVLSLYLRNDSTKFCQQQPQQIFILDQQRDLKIQLLKRYHKFFENSVYHIKISKIKQTIFSLKSQQVRYQINKKNIFSQFQQYQLCSQKYLYQEVLKITNLQYQYQDQIYWHKIININQYLYGRQSGNQNIRNNHQDSQQKIQQIYVTPKKWRSTKSTQQIKQFEKDKLIEIHKFEYKHRKISDEINQYDS